MKADDQDAEPAPGKSVHLEAIASGDARVVQVGGHQHNYYGAGVHGTRRTEPGSTDGECPYPGLAAFGPEHARWFFGRDALTAELVELVDHRQRAGGVQVVVAPSGAGKSSLLRAGLLPRLKRSSLPGSGTWPQLLFTPTADPLTALAEQVVPLLGDRPGVTVEALAADPARCVDAIVEAGGDGPAVVVVDQLEELFTLCPDEERRRAFTEVLDRLAHVSPPALVVVGVRADFYASCANDPVLRAALRDSPLVIGPMSEVELREAVLYPAQDVGLTVEPGLVELLLNDLGAAGDAAGYDAGRLPLLAHALRATWQRREGDALTVAGYRATGGIEGAVARTADRVHSSLDATGRHLTRLLFPRLVSIGDGTEDTRRRFPRAELLEAGGDPDAASAVLAAFTAARLLTQREDTVEITHEALVRAWPALRRWIDEDRAGLLVHQRLAEAATTWERTERDPGALYRGRLLADANVVAADPARPLTELEREFITASGRTQLRSVRRLRQLIALLAILLLTASALGGLAYRQSLDARQQARAAVASGLVGQANALRESDPPTALRLALAAHRLAPTPRTRESLLGLLTQSRYTGAMTGPDGTVRALAYNHDGSMMAVASGHAITLWNVPDRTRIETLRTLTNDVESVRFSDDGTLLGAITDDGTAALWRIDGTRAGPPSTWRVFEDRLGTPFYKSSFVFAPGGRTAYTNGSGAGSFGMSVWDISDPGAPRRLAETQDTGAKSIALSGDGQVLVTAEPPGRSATLWNVSRPAQPVKIKRFDVPGPGVDSPEVAFSPHSATVAAANGNTVSVWDVSRPEQPVHLATTAEHGERVLGLAFHPTADLLATASLDHTAVVWNLSDRTRAARWSTLKGHKAGLYAVAFNPDQYTLATGGVDRSAILWRVGNPTELGVRQVAHGHGDVGLNAVALSRNGELMATADTGSQVLLWDAADPREPRQVSSFEVPLATHSGQTSVVMNRYGVQELAFSDDADLLATRDLSPSGTLGTATLWDVSDPGRPRALAELNDDRTIYRGIALSGNGDVLVTGNEVWDVRAPTAPKRVATLPDHASVTAISPDGDTIVVNGASALWDLTDPAHPRELADVAPALRQVVDVAFSDDGRTLAVTLQDGTTALWDLTDRAHPKPLPRLTGGHDGPVNAVAFAPGGRLVGTVGDDRRLVLWDLTDREHPVKLIAAAQHGNEVMGIAFSPDGTTAITTGADGNIGAWPLEDLTRTVDDFVGRACEIAGDDVSREDWSRLVPGVPFERTCADS
ncbi:hypothetical protein GCM10027184_05140 [Saccharothrix stipae]